MGTVSEAVKRTNCMISPILPPSHAVKFETTFNRSGGIFPIVVNFDLRAYC